MIIWAPYRLLRKVEYQGIDDKLDVSDVHGKDISIVKGETYSVSRNNRTGINKRVFFQKYRILHRVYGK